MDMCGATRIAVDWGTTNRRFFLLDADGVVLWRGSDALGASAVPPGGFAAEMAALRARFGEAPFLLAGMIGSNRGWIETPYLPCPLTLDALHAGLRWVEPGRTAIVPGACTAVGDRIDIMRGEEVQLLGAVAAGMVAPDALLCLPGTHTKWARVAGRALIDFRTVMTGEMFALLRGHSLLAPQLGGEACDGAPFREGVRRGLRDGALLADLFGTRARIVTGRMPPEEAPSYVSGLLLGADLRLGLADVPDGTVALIGAPGLTRLYGAALAEAGRTYHEVDGERAFVAGITGMMEGR